MIRTICFLLLAFCFSCTQNRVEAQSKLSPERFETMLKKDATVQLLDVRTPEEYQSGHIAGATNLNFYDDNFAQQIRKLDKTKPVMVYCAKGGRSASAAEQLSQNGFPQVYDLEGGITAWKEAGKKVEQ